PIDRVQLPCTFAAARRRRLRCRLNLVRAAAASLAMQISEACGLRPRAGYGPIGPPRASPRGGPEGKLRGRPPPPVEPRSGPWRRTGSESGAGRARTRRLWSMTEGSGRLHLAERYVSARRWSLRRRL